MDTASFVAALSTLLAIGLTIALVRMLRLDRQRSEARVASLIALAAGEPAAAGPSIAYAPPVKLEQKRRAVPDPRAVQQTRALKGRATAQPARLSAASIDIFRDAVAAEETRALKGRATPFGDGDGATAGLFDTPVARTRNHLLYIGAGAIVMAALIAFGFRWAVSSSTPAALETTASIAEPAAPAAQPLALVSLRHEQGTDGTLVISGVVRNPPGSIAREKIFAAATLVDSTGDVVATARAPLDFTALAPGEESPFVVRVNGAAGIARYRVGFRDGEGTPVAHVDRR